MGLIYYFGFLLESNNAVIVTASRPPRTNVEAWYRGREPVDWTVVTLVSVVFSETAVVVEAMVAVEVKTLVAVTVAVEVVVTLDWKITKGQLASPIPDLYGDTGLV